MEFPLKLELGKQWQWKLWRDYNVSGIYLKKKKLYITIERPQLLHPIIPLNNISKLHAKKKKKKKKKNYKSKRKSIEIKLFYRIHNIKRPNSFHDPTCSKQITYNQHLSTQTCNKCMDSDNLKPNERDPRRHSRFPSTFLTTNSPEPHI